jgi:hypothetical protein
MFKEGDKVRCIDNEGIDELRLNEFYTIIKDDGNMVMVNTTSGIFYSQTRFEIYKTSALDTQIGGSHYKESTIQPIEFIHANNLNFCQGNIIKYVTRYKNKKGKEDLEKAKHYIDLLIELEYGDKK